MKRVVLDTNVLLVAISKRTKKYNLRQVLALNAGHSPITQVQEPPPIPSPHLRYCTRLF